MLRGNQQPPWTLANADAPPSPRLEGSCLPDSAPQLLAPPLPAWAPLLPVFLRDVERHHLQGLQALHRPAVALAHPLRLHLQEAAGHAAPEHRLESLDIQPRRALRDRVPLLAPKYGRRQGHGILGQGRTGSDASTQRCSVTGQASRPPISDSEVYIKERQMHPGTSEGSPSANKDLTRWAIRASINPLAPKRSGRRGKWEPMFRCMNFTWTCRGFAGCI